jgi:D-sedoheptulose 7-phosphate isomerase
MTDRITVAHFKHLYDLLLTMQVTDRSGMALSPDEGVSQAVEAILGVGTRPGKVMVIGNGGSAAIASHMQCDLCKAVGVRAMAFSETPLLTALTNDHGYQCVFERPAALWADAGDLMVAISSSGQSDNILRAVRAAAGRGCRLITLSGFSAANPLRQLGDINFYIASSDYGYVEAAHAAVAHFLTDSAVKAGTRKRNLRD